MCGIFGIVANQKSKISFLELNGILDYLFVLSESRGKESAGIAIKSFENKSIQVLKKSIPATQMIQSKEFRDYLDSALGVNFHNRVLNSPISIIAHARLVTNGSGEQNENNQPVIKAGNVAVHNGIIVNVDEIWKKYSDLNRNFEVDTEVFLELFTEFKKHSSPIGALRNVYQEIYGSASVALLSDSEEEILLSTNTGSLYTYFDRKRNIFVFSSERFFLNVLVEKFLKNLNDSFDQIHQILPGNGLRIEPNNLEIHPFKLDGNEESKPEISTTIQKYEILDRSGITKNAQIKSSNSSAQEKLLEYNLDSIKLLKRCKRCILPETFPFLSFDKDGICSYCNSYLKQKYLPEEELHKFADQIRDPKGNPDCLVAFSGGRDSSYSLHYIKKELKLNPIAYTYDWGMVTDLARRNQARLCGKLGVEHILISADIKQKRKYISLNVAAWLKRPRLGTIPLFMAGDKQFFYYAYYLRKINHIKETILCENLLERTSFKSGFAGVKPHFDPKFNFALTTGQKIRMLSYYGKEFLLNPSYLNSSLWDSAKAFGTYYVTPHSYFNLFDYLPWEEETIEKTLLSEYDWELSPDTKTTWRIGDGTASFYNYIYYTVAGFSEFETFRSNQIREGMMNRETALRHVEDENKPRFESIKWYLDTIGLDFDTTIRVINKIPKLYSN